MTLKQIQKLKVRDQILQQKIFSLLLFSGNSKGLGSYEPGTMDEAQIYKKKVYIGSSKLPNIYVSYKSQY